MKTNFKFSHFIYSAFLIANLALVPASAWTVKYKVTDLGTFGGATFGYGINNFSEVVGSSSVLSADGVNFVKRAFFWSFETGLVDFFPTPESYVNSNVAYDINDAHQVVGSGPELGGAGGFLWSSDQGFQTLDSLPPVSTTLVSVPYAINDLEQIVGYADWFYVAKSFLWTDSTGLEAIDVGDGGYEGCCYSVSSASDINNLGEVVGGCLHDCIDSKDEIYNGSYLWTKSDGPIYLGTLGYIGEDGSAANAINDASQVVGRSSLSSGAIHAFFWTHNSGMNDLGHLGGDQSEAFGINESGQVVGSSTAGSGSSHAFLWTSGTGMQDLNNLIDSGDPLFGQIELSEAQDINDSGLIVANGALTATGEARAFLLTPIETAQEVAVSLQGLVLKRATCDNLTTGQKVVVVVKPGATAVDCSRAGLSVSAGDKAGVRLQGMVPFNSRLVKTAAKGISLQSAICENQRTKQKVTVRLKPGSAVADCTTAGLKTRPRDSVGIRLLGLIPALG